MNRRLTVPSQWWRDPRRTELAIALGDRDKADGAMLRAWHLAEEFYIPARRGIPMVAWAAEKLPQAVIDVGLARRVDADIFPAFLELVWGWWFNGHVGGKHSAESRQRRYGSAQPGAHEAPEVTSEKMSKSLHDEASELPGGSKSARTLSVSPVSKISSDSGNSKGLRETPIQLREIMKSLPGINPKPTNLLQFPTRPAREVVMRRPRQPQMRYNHGSLAVRVDPWEVAEDAMAGGFCASPGHLNNPRPFGLHNMPCQSGIINSWDLIPDEIAPIVTGQLMGDLIDRATPLDMSAEEALEHLRRWPLPRREDFPDRLTWFHLERRCRNSLTPTHPRSFDRAAWGPETIEARGMNENRARRELERKYSVVELAAAFRDVERNGMLESCAWEIPVYGIWSYLTAAMPAVLERLQRQAEQRARRWALREIGRREREAQRFNVRVRFFRERFPDRPGRRRVIDEVRERFPVIFEGIPRGARAELAVAAHLWGPEQTRRGA